MNRLFRNAAIAGLLIGSFAGLSAAEKGEPKITGSLGWVMGVGNDMDSMKDGFGYTFGMGYHIPTAQTFSYRIHLNAMVFDGAQGSGLNSGRPHIFGGLDLITPISGKVSAFGGIMAMSWNQAAAPSVSNPKFMDTWSAGSRTASRLDGTKLALRAGLEYALTDQAAASLTYTISQANLAYNPSWLTLGFAFKF